MRARAAAYYADLIIRLAFLPFLFAERHHGYFTRRLGGVGCGVTALQHASGAGRMFELFVINSLARGLREAGFCVAAALGWDHHSTPRCIPSLSPARRHT